MSVEDIDDDREIVSPSSLSKSMIFTKIGRNRMLSDAVQAAWRVIQWGLVKAWHLLLVQQ